MLPLDEDGELVMEGYVELNLRLQKCLSKDFVLEQAVDSAVGDWAEDVHEGQQSMTEAEFSMFLFELCSLWCSPGISLRAYLLFLNTAFIAITEARGAHTVGLRDLDAIEHLSKSFFDLVSLQSSARVEPSPEVAGGPNEALNAWYSANLTSDASQQAMLQVQRQVFQVTHDVRAVFLFRDHDGREPDEHDNLQLVRHASKTLSKVSRAQAPRDLPLAPRMPEPRRGIVGTTKEPAMIPWWPHSTAAREKGAPQAPEGRSQALANIATSAAQRRNLSAPGRPVARPAPQSSSLALLPHAAGAGARPPSGARERQEPVPVGRAFETRRAQPKGRGLMVLAGQAAVGGSPRHASLDASTALFVGSRPESRCESLDHSDYASWKYPPLPRPKADLSALVLSQEESVSTERSAVLAWSQRIGVGQGGGGSAQETWLEVEQPRPQHFLEDAQFLPPYKLPKNLAQLYQKQANPLMAVTPGDIVFQANKYQAQNQLVQPPFERCVRKLNPDLLTADSEPVAGPLAKPQEPVWTEMGNRLQAILRKQSRRAERKRKRKIKNKMQRGRGSKPPRRSEGQELREYLDRSAAEHAEGSRMPPGQMGGEFLGKVHERWQQNRERLEMPRFRISGVPGGGIDRHLHPLGGSPRGQSRVVRPVYIPAPDAVTLRPGYP
mmetsp:Transcript_12815/g.35844  ORF Transcript_12815/g.35844 Transcript_12815/m.35844 type:complete len:665 (+) Transcript_12815:186-2180(+)